jgi:hypothetical protein
MNFDLLKARVQKQAAVAADAARSIRNFDQMAANDDYIHHDDLRTPEPKVKRESTPPRKSLSGSSSRQPSKSPPRSASTRATAAQALSQATQFSSLVLPEDDDDFSDNEDSRAMQDEEEEERIKKKKNRNRFMDDLDERLSRAEENNDRTSLEIEAPPPAASLQSPQWSGWLKSPVMVNVLATFQPPSVRDEERKPMLLAAGPLSARRAAQEADSDEEDPMEKHTVVTSSMLGALEQVELERIRMAAKADFIATAFTKLKKNKEFTFILLTLVLGSAAYFYSRHREEIDDVT